MVKHLFSDELQAYENVNFQTDLDHIACPCHFPNDFSQLSAKGPRNLIQQKTKQKPQRH